MDKRSLEIALQQNVVLVVPWPYPVTRKQGYHVRNIDRHKVQIRYLHEEHDVIEQAAEKAGISVSHLIRWVSVYAADAILRDKEIKLEPRHPATTSDFLMSGDGQTFGSDYWTSRNGKDNDPETSP